MDASTCWIRPKCMRERLEQKNSEFIALAMACRGRTFRPMVDRKADASAIHGRAGRSGCTPAEPYPPSRISTLFIDPRLTNHIPVFRGKTSAPRKPESFGALPENEELIAENPGSFSIQTFAAFFAVSAVIAFEPLQTLGHSHISMPWRQKSPAIQTVPFCSALFRQKIFSALQSHRDTVRHNLSLFTTSNLNLISRA
jgi:hypothetical protein